MLSRESDQSHLLMLKIQNWSIDSILLIVQNRWLELDEEWINTWILQSELEGESLTDLTRCGSHNHIVCFGVRPSYAHIIVIEESESQAVDIKLYGTGTLTWTHFIRDSWQAASRIYQNVWYLVNEFKVCDCV